MNVEIPVPNFHQFLRQQYGVRHFYQYEQLPAILVENCLSMNDATLFRFPTKRHNYEYLYAPNDESSILHI